MSQISFFTAEIWTVSEITLYLREIIESDLSLQDLWVQGEISNISHPTSGHLYFTLKDSRSSLRVVIWKNIVDQLINFPENGDAVEIHGSINVYETAGQYQLYGDHLLSAGEGVQFKEFLRLKNKLEQEGLFKPDLKKPLPRYPSKIGLITSSTGAAIKDILDTINRRYPIPDIILVPTQVQGAEAPKGIINALKIMNTKINPDLIILARGGGSIEDLTPFNDEKVARVIIESSIPIITGIGHESDYTIADFVSDMRAPTPTAAAELATPNQIALRSHIKDLSSRMGTRIKSALTQIRWNLNEKTKRLSLLSPLTRVRSDRQRIDEYNYRLSLSLKHIIIIHRTRIDGLIQRISGLSPTAVLNRGFSIVTDFSDTVIRSVGQIDLEEMLNVRVSDGQFEVKVKNKR